MKSVFGKAGRAETATDPAPMEMFETTVQFKPHDQWRPGMTTAKLIEDVLVLPFPDLSKPPPNSLPYTSLGKLFQGRDQFMAELRASPP